MKKLTISIIAAASLAATGVSFAGGPDMNSHHNDAASIAPAQRAGFYLNGGLGYGDITNKVNAAVLGTTTKSGFVWNAAAGYQLNSYFAVETGYLALPEIKNSLNTKVSYHEAMWNLLAKGMYPVSSNLDVFAKAGAGLTTHSYVNQGSTVSSNVHYVVPIIGGGADYYVTNNIAVTGQVLYTFGRDGDNKNTTLASAANPVRVASSVDGLVGITYKF